MASRDNPGLKTPAVPDDPPSSGGGERFRRSGVLVGVFAKHWTPGVTKTRLAATVGERVAADISRAFVEATLDRVGRLEAGIAGRSLVYTPRDKANAFHELGSVRAGVWTAQPQADGDLGLRMRSFFVEALQTHRRALLIGSDSPHLPLPAFTQAAEWLNEPGDGDRLVLGPSEDGGYWLIGARGTPPAIFEDMPWSREDLFATTVSRLSALGWIEGRDYRRVDAWYDVDVAEDLQRMRRDLRRQDPALNRLADRLDTLLGPLDEKQSLPIDDAT